MTYDSRNLRCWLGLALLASGGCGWFSDSASAPVVAPQANTPAVVETKIQLDLGGNLGPAKGYFSWIGAVGERPAVLKILSEPKSGAESFPDIFIRALPEPASLKECEGVEVSVDALFVQPAKGSTIWYLPPNSKGTLKITKLTANQLTAELSAKMSQTDTTTQRELKGTIVAEQLP